MEEKIENDKLRAVELPCEDPPDAFENTDADVDADVDVDVDGDDLYFLLVLFFF